MNAGKDGHVLSDPHVVSDDRIALERQVRKTGRESLPAAAHDVEGVGRDAVHAMVCAVHDKLDAPGDGAEFSDDELVAQKFIVMRDMRFKILRALRVVVIGIRSNGNIRAGNDVFDENDLPDGRIRVDAVRIRSCHKRLLSLRQRSYSCAGASKAARISARAFCACACSVSP